VARLLDTAVPLLAAFLLVRAIVGWLAGAEIRSVDLAGSDMPAIRWAAGVPLSFEIVGHVIGMIVYFTFCQRVAGTTPFKSLLGMRVTTFGGRRPSLARCFLREAVFLFDVVFLGLVAFACMSIGEHRQRLGDFAARTIVILYRPLGRANLPKALVGMLVGFAGWMAGWWIYVFSLFQTSAS